MLLVKVPPTLEFTEVARYLNGLRKVQRARCTRRFNNLLILRITSSTLSLAYVEFGFKKAN